MHIHNIKAREILDSRGNPTVEAEVCLENGIKASALVPSGASTGSKEASELRDGDLSRYNGKGVLNAVMNIKNEINSALKGKEVANQREIDNLLCSVDGTENKSRLGANAILAVSMACARARAESLDEPLYQALNEGAEMTMPIPMMNVLNGGAHADNNVDIQEFMLMPIGAKSFAHALQIGVEVFQQLKSVLKKAGLSTAVGDEGGFAPNLRSNKEALDFLSLATEKAGFSLGRDLVFALDVAASELYKDGVYNLLSENKKLDSESVINYYQELIAAYPIVSIEDGLDENDWDGWASLTRACGDKIQLVGDDLFVTNAKILEKGIKAGIANAILIKPNQVGTLSETIDAINLAKSAGYNTVMSHRSGETEDHFIADCAVAFGCGQIKTGSLCRSERVAKYNQLLRIEEAANLAYAKW